MLLTQAVWLFAAGSASASALTSNLKWNWLNYPGVKAASPAGRSITIQVPPNTDIWRPAASKNNFTAPYLYTTIPAANFQSVQVTVSGPWKTLYDQGGLVIAFPNHRNPDISRFIKTGIEFTDGAPALGVVGTDILSDWSLSPITEAQTGDVKATILVERDGTDAWVYVLENQGKTRRSLRQATWAFNEDDVQGLAKEIRVGIYGAKPTEESGKGHSKDTIAVTFSDFVLKTV
ncbi:hypothetical protein V8C37DRAFT_383150 [Trichoderma ceciliae]